jgi:hypothetical protein
MSNEPQATHHHQSFAARDACPSCRAAMAAAKERLTTTPDPLMALRAALMSRANDGFCKYDLSIVTEVLDQFAPLARAALASEGGREFDKHMAFQCDCLTWQEHQDRSLAPTSEGEGLDVERLARAWAAGIGFEWNKGGEDAEWMREMYLDVAKKAAAEYAARLREARPKEPNDD